MRPVHICRLSRHDSIDTTRERLYGLTTGAQVWLVIPWGHRALCNRFGLRRIARAAEDAALELHIVSRHVQTRLLAMEVGLPAHVFLPPRLWGERSRTRLIKPARRPVAPSTPLAHRRSRFAFGAFLLALLLVVGLVLALAGSVILLLPSAKVTLAPESQTVQAQARITADLVAKDTDYGLAIVPARSVQVIIEGRGDTPATGGIDVSDEHASGDVVFANRTDQPVVVPSGTMVRTSSGTNVRFYTVADVQVPGVIYGHVRVGIIAVDPGIVGNVKAFTINVVESEIAGQVNVLNDRATEGGTTRRAPIVAYRDYDRLRADMIDKLQRQAYDLLVSELDAGEFVPSASLDVQVMAQTFDQVVDERNDVLSMTMKVVARGMAIDGAAVEDVARRLLEASAEKVALIPDSLVIDRSPQITLEDTRAQFDITARGAVGPSLDPDQVKRAIEGQPVTAALEWLTGNLPLAKPPEVTVSPPIWDRLPLLPARIDLVITVGS